MTEHLRVDPIACSGHGLCAELLPELVSLDEWGYPIVSSEAVPTSLRRHVLRAVTDCPALALHLQRRPDPAQPAEPSVPAGRGTRPA